MKSMEFNLDNDQIIDKFVKGTKNIKSTEDFNNLLKELAQVKDEMKPDEYRKRIRSVIETIIINYSKILPNLGENALNVTSQIQTGASEQDLRPIKAYSNLNNIKFDDKLNKVVFDSLCKAFESPKDFNDIDIIEINNLLSKLKDSGFNLATVNNDAGHKSLLVALLINPTDKKFELFKYLVEDLNVSIEDTIRDLNIELDAQKAPRNSEAAKQFLDYIDEQCNTSVKKNKVHLINLAFFFNYENLFKELLNNDEITLNQTVSRNRPIYTTAFMHPDRIELTKLIANSDRDFGHESLKVDEIDSTDAGPLFAVTDYFYEVETEHNRDYESELKQQYKKVMDRLVNHPKYAVMQKNMLGLYICTRFNDDRSLKYIIEVLNSKKIDPSILLINTGIQSGMQNSEDLINTNNFRIIFFTNPGLFETLEAISSKHTKPEEKLMFTLDGIKQFKGLDFKMYGSRQHAEIVKSIDSLSSEQIGVIAKNLGLKTQIEIDDYTKDLKDLAKNKGINIDNSINKLKTALDQEIAPKIKLGFFAQIFTVVKVWVMSKLFTDYIHPPIVNNIDINNYLPEVDVYNYSKDNPRTKTLEDLSVRIINLNDHNDKTNDDKGDTKVESIKQTKMNVHDR